MQAVVILTDLSPAGQNQIDSIRVETTLNSGPGPEVEAEAGCRWRQTFGDEAARGAEARRALAEVYLYPAVDLGLDSGFAVLETNQRAALAEMVAELDRADLAALYHLARLLVLSERDSEIFQYVRVLDVAALAPTLEGEVVH